MKVKKSIERSTRAVLTAALLAFMTSTASAADRSAFFVRHALAVDPGCRDADTRSLPFACHRIRTGAGIVVAVREFKRAWRADRSHFSKLTVVLPEDVRAGQTFNLASPAVRVFFSDGASAFAGKGGCYSTGASGQVSVHTVDEMSIELSIDANFSQQSPLHWPGACDAPVMIRRGVKARLADVEALGAWEGRPEEGDSPFEEAHPSKRASVDRR